MMISSIDKMIALLSKYGILLFIGLAIIFLQNPFGFIEFLTDIQITPRAEVSESDVFATNVSEMLELTSVSKSYVEVDTPYTEVTIVGGLANNCTQGAEFAYIVEVEAGVDLSSPDVARDESTNVVTITLPSPYLTTCRISDSDRFITNEPGLRACESHESHFASMGRFQVISSVRDKAIAGDLLDQVKTRSKKILTDLFGNDIEVEYHEDDSDSDNNDESCSPEVSGGWNATQNENGSYTWSRTQ